MVPALAVAQVGVSALVKAVQVQVEAVVKAVVTLVVVVEAKGKV
jgi:hypothetical protein